MSRSPKKSETLEVRLSYAVKTAFMARCQADGHTASEAVRRFIDQELGGKTRRSGWRWGHAAAAALAGLALGAVAAPSLANTSSRAGFDRIDRDHDGVVTYREYRAR